MVQDQRPKPFRYTLTPRGSVNVFVPKALGADVDRQAMRSSQFGATMMGKLDKLAGDQHFSVCWEAGELSVVLRCWLSCLQVEVATSGTLTPLKPKFWMHCKISMPARACVRIL